MELKLIRTHWTENSTLGDLFVNGKGFSYMLEDKDRGLHDYMTIDEINKIKVKHKTAIPYGKYNVDVTKSERFKKRTPVILNVKGFEGIRMHSGSFVEDTSGCPLFGYRKVFLSQSDLWQVYKSRPAFDDFMLLIEKAILDKEKITIEIIKAA